MSGEKGTCQSCGAPVLWLFNEKTYAMAPIDEQPVAGGNVEVLGLSYRVLGKAARARHDGPLHTNHFARCPDAKRWSTKLKGAARG